MDNMIIRLETLRVADQALSRLKGLYEEATVLQRGSFEYVNLRWVSRFTPVEAWFSHTNEFGEVIIVHPCPAPDSSWELIRAGRLIYPDGKVIYTFRDPDSTIGGRF